MQHLRGAHGGQLPASRPRFKPIEVTYHWSEVQENRSLVERSHTELVGQVPHVYVINVGGADHPIVRSLQVNLKGPANDVKYGYSDNRDVGGEKFVPRRVSYGRNLAEGKRYTVSIPSGNNWGAGDPEGKKLTDGIVGPPYAGGVAFSLRSLLGKEATRDHRGSRLRSELCGVPHPRERLSMVGFAEGGGGGPN